MKFYKILSAMALAATMLTVGCHKSLEYSDVVYFTGTESSPVTNMYVVVQNDLRCRRHAGH